LFRVGVGFLLGVAVAAAGFLLIGKSTSDEVSPGAESRRVPSAGAGSSQRVDARPLFNRTNPSTPHRGELAISPRRILGGSEGRREEECECPADVNDDGWHEYLDGDFRPEEFERAFSEALAEDQLADAEVEYDCARFPCLAILREEIEMQRSSSVLDRLRQSYGEEAGTRHVRHYSVGAGGKEHIVVYSVFPPEFDADPTLLADLDERILGWQMRTTQLVIGE